MFKGSNHLNICSALSHFNGVNSQNYHQRLRKLYPCVEDVSKLPQTWSPISKAAAIGLTHDNLGCYFRRNDDEKMPAAIKTDNFILSSCLIYYFEVEFVSKGREGYMAIGLATDKTQVDKLPGWERESYGYHADDGNVFAGTSRGHQFGPTSTTGDIVGCGYNIVEGKIFFTKNGTCLGKAFNDVPGELLYYPTIGLKTYGEEILANFGQKEFKYDIEQDLRSLRKNMTFNISNYPISDFSEWQNILHKLVQSWLLENSYADTAEAFTKSAKIECKENLVRVQQRYIIQQLVMEGRISEAIKSINCLFPDLLQDNPKLSFFLKCREFIELIGDSSNIKPEMNNSNNHENHDVKVSTNVDAGLDYDEERFAKLILLGQELTESLQHLSKTFGKDDANEKFLQDAISLIAYIDPKREPGISKLLDPGQREPISQMLNSSILNIESNDSTRPPLEDIMNHLKSLIRLNNSQGHWLVDRLY